MDPNENLKEQRALAGKMVAAGDRWTGGEAFPDPISWTDAARLAELVQALDGWLSKGGAFPSRWLADKLGALR